MDLNNGYFLTKDNVGYFVYKGKIIKRIVAKDFKEAVREALLISKKKI